MAIRFSLLFRAALIALSLQAGTALAHANDAPDRLSTAKSIELQETYFSADKSGKLSPNTRIKIWLARVGKTQSFRILLTPLQKTDQKVKASFYIESPKGEFEYNGYSDTYREVKRPEEGSLHSTMRYIACMDILQDLPAQFQPNEGTHRTFGQEMLDGRTMRVRSDLYPQKGPDGAEVVYSDKLYVDAETGLPYRRASFKTQVGKTTPTLQLDLFGWAWEKPIIADRFAFTPPAGSRVFTIPFPLSKGENAPDFTVVTPDEKKVRLSDYRGKVVVIDLWATWCGPCKQSMPHLEKVYQQTKGRDVVLLAVCVWDEKDEYDQWRAKNAGSVYHFPVAFDPAGKNNTKSFSSALYRVTGIPTTFVIGKDGKIAATLVGYTEGEHRLEDALKQLGVEGLEIEAAGNTAAEKNR